MDRPSSNPFSGGAYIDEITEATVEVLQSGAPLKPEVVKPTALTGKKTSRGWQHVLVQIKAVSVTAEVNSYGEFKVPGLAVDDEFHAHSPKKGDCLDITGIPYFFYFIKLNPRSAADIQTATGCTGPVKLAIKDLQDTSSTKHPATATQVTVSGVISAVDSTKTGAGDYVGFYIQEPSGGTHSGIYVYHQWQDSSTLKPKQGDAIELTGTYDEYNGVSELKNVSWTVTGTGTVPAPLVVKPATLAAGGASAEPYEGVLVQVQGIEVGAHLVDSKKVQIGFTDKTTKLPIVHKLYDFMAPTPPKVGTKYKTITGPLAYVTTFEIMPRGSGDMVLAP